MKWVPVYRVTGIVCLILGRFLNAADWKVLSLVALCFLLAEIRDTWEGGCSCNS